MVWPLGRVDSSVTEDDALGAVEGIGTGDDYLVARRHALQDFDFGYAGGAELHRMALGNISMNDVGEAAALLVHERPAVDHQYVVAPIDENTHRQALALPQACRFLGTETQPCGDLAGNDFGRHAADDALPVMPTAFQISGHPRAQIARQTFRHFDLDLEGRQVHHREQWCVLGDAGTVRHLHLAYLTVHRRLDVQAVNLALEVIYQILLTIEQCLLAVDIEAILLGLRIIGALGL